MSVRNGTPTSGSNPDRSSEVPLFGQRVIHACPCGATADGQYPERLIHRGNCPWSHEQTRAVTVVLAADYDAACGRLRAENERLREAARPIVEACETATRIIGLTDFREVRLHDTEWQALRAAVALDEQEAPE